MIHNRNITALILLCILSTFCSLGATGKNFVHPGLLHSREAIERTRGWVQHRNEVAMGSYEKLLRDAKAQSSYRMAGPFEVIARDGEHRRTKSASENDFLAAYYNALLFVITGDVQHAETSLNIIRSYASTLQRIDGHDAPLCAGLQGFILVNACELLRYCYSGWSAGDSKSTEAMFRRAFLPVLDDFVTASNVSASVDMGIVQIPANLIVGTKTKGRMNAFSSNFMPILEEGTEFSDKWKRLCEAHLTEGIRDPIKAYEYMNRYYVEEGNKRVSVLKFFDAVAIPGHVIRLMPEGGGEEVELYNEFLEFYKLTLLNSAKKAAMLCSKRLSAKKRARSGATTNKASSREHIIILKKHI